LRTLRPRSQVDQLFTHRRQLAQAEEAYRLFDRRTQRQRRLSDGVTARAVIDLHLQEAVKNSLNA
jgi:hypothetical protein